MTVEETLFQLKLHGWCLIENVIPAAEVNGVRQSIEATAAEYARPDADDINIPDVLNVNQSFAPYLAHAAILEPLRALWGPYVRMRTAKLSPSRAAKAAACTRTGPTSNRLPCGWTRRIRTSSPRSPQSGCYRHLPKRTAAPCWCLEAIARTTIAPADSTCPFATPAKYRPLARPAA